MNATVVEPDPEEAARLRLHYSRVIESVLWSDPPSLELHLTRSPGCVLSVQAHRAFLEQTASPDRFDLTRTIPVTATTIDAVALPEIDVMKLDTQGAELAILKGEMSRLQRRVGLEVEVEFADMYPGAAAFRGLDKFVREP